MDASAEYCELCDLPLVTCVHGQPPAPAPEKTAPQPRVARASRPAPRSPARSTRPRQGGATTVKASPRVGKWTPPEMFAPFILDVLAEAGGELDADAMFAALEEQLGENFRSGDREPTPPTGELRWQVAARRARQQLIADGRMVKGAPGMWVLA